MKKLLPLAFVFLILSGFSVPGNDKEENKTGSYDGKFHIVGDSRTQFMHLFNRGRDRGYFFYEQLTDELLPYFANLPYGTGGTNCKSDQTLVNFTSFDCVTFVESYWALVNTIFQYQSGKTNYPDPFQVFARNLDRIRYFGGENCGIQYRIHYFTQAMQIMEHNQMVFNVGIANGVPFKKKINYLTENQGDSYSKEYYKRMKSLEKILSESPNYYYPLKNVSDYLPLAKTGDIIAFGAQQEGLDVSHTGIISVVDGEVKLTHASSLYDKLVYQQDLREYLAIRKTLSGVFVWRPIFK
ncbi:MAG: DUF1460 domain-containing protein [Bacteroidia bacterium]|nr:DUF1460 domain-containing protein [Bacteroidia bacterium]